MSVPQQIYKKDSLQKAAREIDPDAHFTPEVEDLLQRVAQIFVRNVTEKSVEQCMAFKDDELTDSHIHNVLAENYDFALPGDLGRTITDESHQPRPSADYCEKLTKVRKFMAQRNED